MKKQFLMIVLALSALVLATSCQKVPKEQIDAAIAAVEAVNEVDATTYAQNEFDALKDSLSAALLVVEVQKSKTFKNFDAAIAKLDAIVANATVVAEKTAFAKQMVKAEAEAIADEVKLIIEEINLLMLQAPKGKEGAMVLEAMKYEIALIENALAEVNQLIADDNFVNARLKATAAKINAEEIRTELTEAISKIGRK